MSDKLRESVDPSQKLFYNDEVMNNNQLGELEQQIMEIVWNKKQCSVREIVEELQKTRKVAYTTVATVVQRLQEKKFLTKKSHGKTYIYSPKFSKELFTRNVARSFMNRFFSSFGDVAISSFAESIEDLPREKRVYLLRLLEQHDKNI